MARLSLCVGSNRTPYRTADLVGAVRACMAAFPVPAGPYVLDFAGAYNGKLHDGSRLGARGVAHIDAHKLHRQGYAAHLALLVKPGLDLPAWREVQWTLEHEVGHLIGWRHGPDYAAHDARHAAAGGAAPAWGRDLPVPALAFKPLKGKPSADSTRADRILHAEAMLARAETRAKRAASIVDRWTRKIIALRRADRRAASKGTP
jgi:hypothetical protein